MWYIYLVVEPTPFAKICSSKCVHLPPIFGLEITKRFQKPPPRRYVSQVNSDVLNLGPNRASRTANKSPNKSSTEVSAGAWPGKKSFNKKRLEAQHNGAPRCWWLNQPIWKICSLSWIISSNLGSFLVPPPSPLCCPKTPNSSYQIISNDLPIFLVAWTSIYWCFVLFQ